MGCQIMVTAREWAGKHALILGAGVTGTAVAEVLRKRGVMVSIVDEKVTSGLESSGFISMGAVSLTPWDLAVASPGWRPTHPLVVSLRSRGVSIVSEIDLAWSLRTELVPSQRWLGITGTNGKTTTVEMTIAMLLADGRRAKACGNVGDTVIEAVTGEITYDDLVIELSSFQLQWSKLPQFHASAILNIADDHVDWHGSFAEYISAKLRILERADLAILNGDDGVVVDATQHWHGRKVFFSLGAPSEGELGVVENLLVDRAFVSDPVEATVIAELEDIQPSVTHNVANALAAAGLARSVGVSHEVIRRALQNFHPGRHRIETIFESDGIKWVNDSKATNPHAAIASLLSQHSVIWIAGGLAKGADMHELVGRTKDRIKAAILIGQDGALIEAQLRLQAPNVTLIRVEAESGGAFSFMERIVLEAQRLAIPGDTVLLAPACASMDQFISYGDRGDQFVDAVNKLIRSS
jgi:UDP-N-acetylmuramoylalanine--D-glutamate ligase